MFRVLVVEDDADTLDMMVTLLRRWGHEPIAAADGPTAVAAAAAVRPRVVLLDLGLPGMAGWEVAQRLRASAATRDVPILVLTGLPAERARQLASAAGVDHFLTKPLEPEAVRALLEQYAGRPVAHGSAPGWLDPRVQLPALGELVLFETSGVVARLHTGTYASHGPGGEPAFVNDRGVAYTATVAGWRPLHVAA